MEIREPCTEARRMQESQPQGPRNVLCTDTVLHAGAATLRSAFKIDVRYSQVYRVFSSHLLAGALSTHKQNGVEWSLTFVGVKDGSCPGRGTSEDLAP